jgi:hypothetical protein
MINIFFIIIPNELLARIIKAREDKIHKKVITGKTYRMKQF